MFFRKKNILLFLRVFDIRFNLDNFSIVLYFKIQYSGTKAVISLNLGVRSGNILPDEQDKVWESGGAWITVVGIICPPGWDRVNCLAKNWGLLGG